VAEIKTKSQVKRDTRKFLGIRRYNKFQKRCPSRRTYIDVVLDNCRVGCKGGVVTRGYRKIRNDKLYTSTRFYQIDQNNARGRGR
jgi:hypothetical protein